jgi:hypothetical protein
VVVVLYAKLSPAVVENERGMSPRDGEFHLISIYFEENYLRCTPDLILQLAEIE